MRKKFFIITILPILFLNIISYGQPEMITIIPFGEKAEFLMGATIDELKNQPHRANDPDYSCEDEKAHKVVLTIPYEIGKYEITNAQFIEVMNYALEKGRVKLQDGDLFDKYNRKLIGVNNLIDHPYLGLQKGLRIENDKLIAVEGKKRFPVHAVTWIGAVSFCNYLSEKNGLKAAYDLKELTWLEGKDGYRLPTEAEWEYAARENQRYVYAWGNEFAAQYSCSNDYNDSIGWDNFFTPVGYFDGSLKADGFQTKDNSSPFGVYDMTGNVWEWCWDWYSAKFYEDSPIENPKGPEGGELRPPYDTICQTKVWRGCGFAGTAEYSRITKRWSLSTEKAVNEVGFRVCRTITK